MAKVGDGIAKVVYTNGVYRITIEKSVAEELGLEPGDLVHYMIQELELNDDITRLKKSLKGPKEQR